MIKVIKIRDLVYQGIEAKVADEKGNITWNIPNDLKTLRNCVVDTFNWLIGQEVKKTGGGDFTKLSAANSKAIVLLVKALSANADTSKFTDTEKQVWTAMQNSVNAGYCDSKLLLNSITAVTDNIQTYSAKIDKALAATSVDELIALLEG